VAPALKTVRIIVIEDNPADILLVKKALQQKGIAFSLSCFENGEKALKALLRQDRKAPDLILLDLNLPTIEGIAVLLQIRSMPKLSGVPVVILTSSESSSDMRRAERLGAARYMAPDVAFNEAREYLPEMLEAWQIPASAADSSCCSNSGSQFLSPCRPIT
jgi:CheY-like chemotaxis protein